MKFPNAAKGVKTFYWAVIIIIVVMGLTAIGAALAVLAGEDQESPILVLVAFIGIALLALGIIGLIMELVGTNKAGNDNPTFKKAFYCIIINLVASLVGGFANNKVFADVVGVLTTVLDLLVIYFVLTGIIELAKDINDAEMQEKGLKTRKLYMIVFIVSLVLDTVGLFTDTNESLAVISNVLSVVAAVVSIVAFVMVFLYLKKSVPMLENAKAVEEKKEDKLDALNLDAAEEKKDDFE